MSPAVVKESHGLRQRRDSQDRQQRQGLLSGKRYSRRSKLLLLILGFSWLLIFFLVLFFSVQLYLLSQENQELRIALEDSQAVRDPLAEEVARLQAAMEDLLAGRLPGLTEIVFDEVIPLEREYLKNILFSRITRENEVDYEYRLILENSSFFRVWPRVTLYFFDEFGIQLGAAEIGPEAMRETGDDSSLAPGESQSFSDFLEFTEARPPHYFRVRLDSLPVPEAGLSGEDNEESAPLPEAEN